MHIYYLLWSFVIGEFEFTLVDMMVNILILAQYAANSIGAQSAHNMVTPVGYVVGFHCYIVFTQEA